MTTIVTAICARPSRTLPVFSGRVLARPRCQARLPEAFVKALTDAGYLAALIPEKFGGSGLGIAEASVILEEINRSGAQRRRVPRADVHDGHAAPHGSDAQKREYLPRIATGELRLQAFGVSEPTTAPTRRR
jgi:acyl-CoA dehydrogenase